jgi:hypothetical protein
MASQRCSRSNHGALSWYRRVKTSLCCCRVVTVRSQRTTRTIENSDTRRTTKQALCALSLGPSQPESSSLRVTHKMVPFQIITRRMAAASAALHSEGSENNTEHTTSINTVAAPVTTRVAKKKNDISRNTKFPKMVTRSMDKTAKPTKKTANHTSYSKAPFSSSGPAIN